MTNSDIFDRTDSVCIIKFMHVLGKLNIPFYYFWADLGNNQVLFFAKELEHV